MTPILKKIETTLSLCTVEWSHMYILLWRYLWLYGAMVARLTPDQKAGCSSHSGVMYNFSIFIFRDYFLRLRTSLVYNWVYCIVIHTFSNQILVEATFMYVSYSCSFLVILTSRFYGVMVSTLDFESSDPSSNLGRT